MEVCTGGRLSPLLKSAARESRSVKHAGKGEADRMEAQRAVTGKLST